MRVKAISELHFFLPPPDADRRLPLLFLTYGFSSSLLLSPDYISLSSRCCFKARGGESALQWSLSLLLPFSHPLSLLTLHRACPTSCVVSEMGRTPSSFSVYFFHSA